MRSACAPWRWMGTAVHLFTPDFSCYHAVSGRVRGSSHRLSLLHRTADQNDRAAPRVPSLVAVKPSASYSLTVRVSIANRPGMLGRVAVAIGAAGGDIGAGDLVESTRDRIVRDIAIDSRDSTHSQQIVDRLKHLTARRRRRFDVSILH